MSTEHYVGSRLFLSCDLVGSTRLKQSGRSDWIPHFLQFYRGFPSRVSARLAQTDPARSVDAAKLTLWKPVGDELIFTYDLDDEAQVRTLVRAWVEAMDEYNEDLKKVGLGTKGAAFLATFPSPDREVAIPMDATAPQVADDDVEAANENAVVTKGELFMHDYLGPSIDTGFRVSGVCDNRYFRMSLEVAWAFAVAETGRKASGTDDFTLMDSIALKGVWNGREYPVFALDRHTGREDDITLKLNAIRQLESVKNKESMKNKQVVELAEACHDDRSWPCKIYLPGSTYVPFTASKDMLEQRAAELDRLHDQHQINPEDRRRDEMTSKDRLGSDVPVD